MIRSSEKLEGSTLRVAMLSGADAGLGEDGLLMNVLRLRGGVWMPVTPTLVEIDKILDAMEDAEPGVWYWLL